MKLVISLFIILSVSLSLSISFAQEVAADQNGEAEISNVKCEAQYQNLITKYGKEYTDCYGKIKRSECEKQNEEERNKTTNLVMILDASGSMAARISGGSKMDIAKQSAKEFTRELAPETNVSLIVYGHKGSNNASDKELSCTGVEVVQELEKINPNQLETKIDPLKATGWTSIGGSLLKAEEILADYPPNQYRNIVVLISDGKETCGRDPVQIAGEINKSDVEIITNVVGFGVGGSAEQQLKDLATQGKGEYYAAHSSGELNLALAKMSQQNICSTKETMAKMESLFSVNTTNTKCLFRINTELQSVQVGINMLGITKEKDEKTGITTDCKKYVMGKYKERAESIRAQIEDIHTESMEKINSQQ